MQSGIKNHGGDVRQFPWLEAMLTALDDRLRLRHGVVEYTRNPDCLFRIQLATSDDDYVLSDGACVRGGDRIANLHVWNEQFPCFAGNGPTLAWARRGDRPLRAAPRGIGPVCGGRAAL